MSVEHEELLLFQLKNLRCALLSSLVVEVIAATSVVPLPGAPPLVKGLVNVRGTLVPVLDVRPRLGLDPKPVEPSDHFILTRSHDRLVALIVDRAEALQLVAKDTIDEASKITQTPGIVRRIARLPDGLLLIHEPDMLLSESEELSLAHAMAGQQG